MVLELPDVPVYECGGCGTRLRAKFQNNNAHGTASGLQDRSPEGMDSSPSDGAVHPSEEGSQDQSNETVQRVAGDCNKVDNAEGNIAMDDRTVMTHLRNDNDISWVCQFCRHPFPWEVLPETFRHHLTRICERAPEDVKEAAQRREVEAAECSRSVNWEPTRILDARENNDSNFEAETEGSKYECQELQRVEEVSSVQRTQRGGNIVQRSNKRQGRFDVFLSFRGEDTRYGFINHLYEALCKNQILTFIDNNLERGDDIYPSLITVIEESTICLIIFSKNYAGSKLCLKELAKILQCRKLNGQIIIPVFYRIDPSHIKNQTGKFGVAFDKHKERLREGEMDLDDVRSHLEEAANISGWNSHNKSKSELIKSIVGDILNKLNLCSNKRHRNMPDALPIAAQAGKEVEAEVSSVKRTLEERGGSPVVES